MCSTMFSVCVKPLILVSHKLVPVRSRVKLRCLGERSGGQEFVFRAPAAGSGSGSKRSDLDLRPLKVRPPPPETQAVRDRLGRGGGLSAGTSWSKPVEGHTPGSPWCRHPGLPPAHQSPVPVPCWSYPAGRGDKQG